MRELVTRKPAHPQQLMLADGTRLTTPHDIRTAWQSWFGGKLGGTPTTSTALLDANTSYQGEQFPKLSAESPRLSVDDLPSMHDTIGPLKTSPTGRGHGEDVLCGEIARADAHGLAIHLHPLYLKALCGIQEPLQWQGGMLSELLKGVADAASRSNYRDILVSDHTSKRLHSWVKPRIMVKYSKHARKSQHAGTQGMGTDLCAHLTRSWWGHLMAQGLSGAQLSIDVASAFAPILMQLRIGGDVSDLAIASIMKAMSFGPDIMHELAKYITTSSYLMHINTVIADMHKLTWFTTQSLRDPCGTSLGTKAGDTMANICYIFK